MPELPEVETFARSLRPVLVGQTITAATLFWPRTLATPSETIFLRRVENQHIEEITRRAKYLHFRLSAGSLFIHLRMSGDLVLRQSPEDRQPHDRLHLILATGQALAFNDTRKFGRIWLVDDPNEVIGHLGPEPFDPQLDPPTLHAALTARKRQLKPLLLDQSFLAGLGNIYTDEALHLAGLHPQRQSDTISLVETNELLTAIRLVLQTGIENNGASIDWVYRGGNFQNHFRVYGRTGQPCPVCGKPIQRCVVGQRSTHFCPRCQL